MSGIYIIQEHEKNTKYESEVESLKTTDTTVLVRNTTDKTDMTSEERRKEIYDDLVELRSDTDPYLATTRANNIRNAVNASIVSWEELDTDEEGLEKYIHDANVRGANIYMEKSKKKSYFERKYHTRELNSLLMR